jgi:tRNA dimethylallyltransferase
MSMRDTVLFPLIYGPTASGKTAKAYQLAVSMNADILSFDSRHVYREMTIVTGKDLPPSTASFTVYGLDLINPDEEFSIRHFYEYARPIIHTHREQNKPLILVGGSWQYASVLLDPPESLFAERNSDRATYQSLSREELQKLVQLQNPQRWHSLNESDRENPRRLIRALEIPEKIKHKPEALLETSEYRLDLLNPPLEHIEEKIRLRIDERLNNGALEETTFLMKKYPDWSFPAFSSTGYKILRRYVEQEISLEEAKNFWFLQERQYVKRQKTWMKKISHRL